MKLSISKCLGQFMTTVVLLFAVTAHAEQENIVQSLEEESSEAELGIIGDDDSSTHGNPNGGFNSYCQQYSYNPRQCEQIQGCQYSRIYSQCVSSNHGGGGGGPVQPVPPNYCSQYNYNYQSCVSAGCQFNGQSGQCFGGGGYQPQPPHPQPNYCSRYNYNQYQCQSAQGCFYDYRSGACTQQGGGGGGHHPGPRGFICTAADQGYEEHGSLAHQGRGRSQYDASQQALYSCSRYHGQCVVTSCRPE